MASPRPKPAALKIISGNPGKRRIPKEPELQPGNIDPPGWVRGVARDHWVDIVNDLKNAGIFTALDRVALGMYCEAYAKWIESMNAVRTYGMVTEDRHGAPCVSPYHKTANDAFNQLRQMLTEFGMTPSARTKVAGQAEKRKNEFDDF